MISTISKSTKPTYAEPAVREQNTLINSTRMQQLSYKRITYRVSCCELKKRFVLKFILNVTTAIVLVSGCKK